MDNTTTHTESAPTTRASTQNSTGNVGKRSQVQRHWHELLEQALVRGFYGTVALEVVLQDGTIQVIRRRLEQLDK